LALLSRHSIGFFVGYSIGAFVGHPTGFSEGQSIDFFFASSAPEIIPAATSRLNCALSHCLRHIAHNLIWTPGHKGGREPLLFDDDIAIFLSVFETRAKELNCATTTKAKNITIELPRAQLFGAEQMINHSIKTIKQTWESFSANIESRVGKSRSCLEPSGRGS
jgi:hypothetical protein